MHAGISDLLWMFYAVIAWHALYAGAAATILVLGVTAVVYSVRHRTTPRPDDYREAA
jgi:hypothetical protein